MDAQSQTMPHIGAPRRPTVSTALWGHLLRKAGSSQIPPSSGTSTSTFGKHTPPIAPIDKTSASTRVLLHDTQAHLEKFTERVTQLTNELDDAKRELVMVQKLYQDDREQVLESITGLVNRCQTEMQKTVGSPAQRVEIREVSKDLSHISIRIDTLDKKIDALSMVCRLHNQTQSQLLQTIQDQQGHLLAALTPLLPLIQAMPLHIENARDRVKDALSNLQKELLQKDSVSSRARNHGYALQLSGRSHDNSSSPCESGNPASTHLPRKKRRLEAVGDISEGATLDTSLGFSGYSLPRAAIFLDHSSVGRDSTNPQASAIPLSTLVSRLSSQTPSRTPLTDRPGFQSHITTPAVPLRSVSTRLHAGALSGRGSLQSRTLTDVLGVSCTPDHTSHTHSGQSLAHPLLSPTRTAAGTPCSAGGLRSVVSSVRRAPQSRTVSKRPPPGPQQQPVANMNYFASASPASRDPALSSHMKHESLVPSKRRSRTLRTPEAAPGCGDSVAALPITPTLASTTVADGAHALCMPPPSIDKPMSLKDRRALLAEDPQRTEGKRFIPLDDEDDDDSEVMP
ncbi:hypothetical protein OH77DRAFT_1239240 [Trametes cingulata]|nr:hypothetical protein OH77DRAFT_1239240 [Trametes cingulata]